jgi:hypothetical protein
MADRTDEDEARAARTDYVVDRVGGRGGATRGRKIDHLFLILFAFVRGTHTPRFAHSAPMRATDFLQCFHLLKATAAAEAGFFCPSTYPSGMKDS